MKNRLMILALAVTVLATVRQAGENPHHRTEHHRQRNHHTRGNHSKKPRRGTERGRI